MEMAGTGEGDAKAAVPGPGDRFIALSEKLGFLVTLSTQTLPAHPSWTLRVPDTQKRGIPRSPSALRSAPPGRRAPTPSRAGQTSIPTCSRRLRRPLQSPPRARRRPPLPYWGKGEKTAPPVPTAAALKAQEPLRTAPSVPVPRAARGLNPGALQLLPRRPRPSSSKRENHPGTDSNPYSTSLPRPAAPREEGARGALLLALRPAPAAAQAHLAALPENSAAAQDCGAGGRGAVRVSEKAGRVPQAAQAGAGFRRPRPASFALAKLEGSAGVRGRLRSGGRPSN